MKIKHFPDKKALKKFAVENGITMDAAERVLVDSFNKQKLEEKQARSINRQLKRQSKKFARLADKKYNLWDKKAIEFYYDKVNEKAEKEGFLQVIDAKTMLGLYDQKIEDDLNSMPYYEDIYGDEGEVVELNKSDVKQTEKKANKEFEETKEEIKQEVQKTKGNIQYNNYGTILNVKGNALKQNAGKGKE